MKKLSRIIFLILVFSMCLSACSKKEGQTVNEKTPIVTSKESSTTDNVAKKQASAPTILLPSNKTENVHQDKMVENKEKVSDVSTYEAFLNSLNKNNIYSISLAVKKYISIKSDDKFYNDDLYRSFYRFYYTIIDSLNNSQEDLNKLDKSDLNVNGLVVIDGEAGPFIHEKSDFVATIFCNSVSEGVKEFIDINNKIIKLMGEGYIFEDALLT